MTKTTYSREDIATHFASAVSLGDVFKEIEKKLESQGEMVCQFRVNGLTLSEVDEQRMARTDIQELDFIEIESRTPNELIVAVIENWITELPVLIEKADKLAQDIKFAGIEGNLNAFAQLIDTCQFLVESLISLEKLVVKDEHLIKMWSENEQLTMTTIGEALKAFEAKDFTLLAEIFEYDLGHMLQIWLEFLKLVQDNLKHGVTSK